MTEVGEKIIFSLAQTFKSLFHPKRSELIRLFYALGLGLEIEV